MSLFIAIVTWIVFGFLVGLVARAITPGDQGMSFWSTTALGILGSIAGALTLSFITHHGAQDLHPIGFLGSVVGAVLLLAAGIGLRRASA